MKQNQGDYGSDRPHEAEIADIYCRRVCLIKDADELPVGTGSLVGPDLILTNLHVYDSLMRSQPVSRSSVTFDDFKWEYLPLRRLDVNFLGPNCFVCGDSDLDYAILRLSSEVGNEKITIRATVLTPRLWFRLFRDTVQEIGNGIFEFNGIHYPQGTDQKSKPGQHISSYSEPFLVHDMNTQTGSSGAILYANNGKLIAIHKGFKQMGDDVHNVAIPLALICKHIEESGFKELLDQGYPSPSISDFDIRRSLVAMVSEFISHEVIDIQRIRLYFLLSLPDTPRHIPNIKAAEDISDMLWFLVDQGGDPEICQCPLLTFLQYLQVAETETISMQTVNEIISHVCNYWSITANQRDENREAVQEKMNNLGQLPSKLILLIEKDDTRPSEDFYGLKVIVRLGNKSLANIQLPKENELAKLNNATELAYILSKHWASEIEQYIISTKLEILIGISERHLTWKIEQLEIREDHGISFRLADLGPVSFLTLLRYKLGITKILLQNRWDRIESHARISKARIEYDSQEIERDLMECRGREKRWVSCFIENRNGNYAEQELGLLLKTGVPAMVWVTEESPRYRGLFPSGDFRQSELLGYAYGLRDILQRRNLNSVSFLLDQPTYYSDLEGFL